MSGRRWRAEVCERRLGREAHGLRLLPPRPTRFHADVTKFEPVPDCASSVLARVRTAVHATRNILLHSWRELVTFTWPILDVALPTSQSVTRLTLLSFGCCQMDVCEKRQTKKMLSSSMSISVTSEKRDAWPSPKRRTGSPAEPWPRGCRILESMWRIHSGIDAFVIEPLSVTAMPIWSVSSSSHSGSTDLSKSPAHSFFVTVPSGCGAAAALAVAFPLPLPATPRDLPSVEWTTKGAPTEPSAHDTRAIETWNGIFVPSTFESSYARSAAEGAGGRRGERASGRRVAGAALGERASLVRGVNVVDGEVGAFCAEANGLKSIAVSRDVQLRIFCFSRENGANSSPFLFVGVIRIGLGAGEVDVVAALVCAIGCGALGMRFLE